MQGYSPYMLPEAIVASCIELVSTLCRVMAWRTNQQSWRRNSRLRTAAVILIISIAIRCFWRGNMSQAHTKAATIIQSSAAMEACCTRDLAKNRRAMAIAASTYVTLTAALFTPRRLAVRSVPGGGSPKTLLDMSVATCRGRHIEWTGRHRWVFKIEIRF